MASLSEIRQGIATNLRTIRGLRTEWYMPTGGQINPPYAIITPDGIEYHKSFADGINTFSFTITVVVGQASERAAQTLIDAYVSPTGEASIKKAIESDKTLAGKAFTLIVSDMKNYGSLTIGETQYLAAEFSCDVQAN